MRGKCEFKNCPCNEYHGLNNICLLCKHGKCWHKNLKNKVYNKENYTNNYNQFESTRESAHKPVYVFGYVQNRYTQPSEQTEQVLEYNSGNFCNSVDDLPA
tara:strand:- start:96 stop:398 length:303 start_codon:yes stop_codon:yes gene_type:complete